MRRALQAILDNCCHLQFLDLRKCFNVVLTGDLRKRCSQQINDLRHPNDHFAEYYYDYFDGISWYVRIISRGHPAAFSDYVDDYCFNFSEYDEYEEASTWIKKNYWGAKSMLGAHGCIGFLLFCDFKRLHNFVKYRWNHGCILKKK